MSWTGNVAPRRLKVTTEYEHGRLMRQLTQSQDAGGSYNVTDIRCTCDWPTAGCTLHSKETPQ